MKNSKRRCAYVVDRHVTGESPATALFPQFETELYRMISTEVEGLTEGQLDFHTSRATVSPHTEAAPASFSAVAQADRVLPVVATSSTKITDSPLRPALH